MSSTDGLTAFLRVLRSAVYKTTKFLFYSLLNTICAALLIVSCLVPWRLCALIFGWNSFHRTWERLLDGPVTVASLRDYPEDWREASCRHFFMTVRDCFVLPFAVLALVTPTRTFFTLKILVRAWANDTAHKGTYEKIRKDFFTAGLTAPFDLLGVAAALVCAVLPWPTCIFRCMAMGWRTNMNPCSVSKQVSNLNLHTRLALYCLVTSLVEMPFAVASLVLGLVTPTRTVATLRVFGNHLYYRASLNVYWTHPYGVQPSMTKIRVEKPVLFKDSVSLICGAVLDWITAPALAVVLVGGAARLPKLYERCLSIIDNSKSSPVPHCSTKHHLRSPWSATPWPFCSDVTSANPHNGGNGKGFLFRYKSESKINDSVLVFHVLHHSLHYNVDLRYVVWVHFCLVLIDLFVLPFAVLATFGIVHTKYFFGDVKRLWCPRGKNPPASSTASGAGSAVALDAGTQSASAYTKASTHGKAALPEEKRSATGTIAVTVRHVSTNVVMNSRAEEEDDRGGIFHQKHGFDVRFRKSAVYHGVMTVVDILFLPPILFVVFTISRAPKMLTQLRNGFDNEARRIIFYCATCAIGDMIILPFLLVACSPLGMIFGRDKPLRRNFPDCAKNINGGNKNHSPTETSTAAAAAAAAAAATAAAATTAVADQPPLKYDLEGDLSRWPKGKLDMSPVRWYWLVLRQFCLIMLDLAVLPFTCIVFCTHHTQLKIVCILFLRT